MTEMELYQSWRKNAIDDPDLQSELSAIENDAEAIQDRFYRDLAFGTGGLRGVIGAGTNRMNIYTVRKATQGLANYVKEAFSEPSVAISYDSETAKAPVVLAKGEDYLAMKIREIAKENQIEIVENKPLARTLYATVDVGQEIPPELYQAVAEVLAMVYHMKNQN